MSEWKVTYRGIVYPWALRPYGTYECDVVHRQVRPSLLAAALHGGAHTAPIFARWNRQAAVEQHIQDKRELHAGDAVTIHSALLEVKTNPSTCFIK